MQPQKSLKSVKLQFCVPLSLPIISKYSRFRDWPVYWCVLQYCAKEMQTYFAKICAFLCFLSKKYWLFNGSKFLNKVIIIRDTYCFQICKFPNDDLLRTKIDFTFSSKNLLCSINGFKHLRKILFYNSSNIPWLLEISILSRLFINCRSYELNVNMNH